MWAVQNKNSKPKQFNTKYFIVAWLVYGLYKIRYFIFENRSNYTKLLKIEGNTVFICSTWGIFNEKAAKFNVRGVESPKCRKHVVEGVEKIRTEDD